MIIATGNVNIDENAKLAQDASTKVDTAGEKFQTSLDGKITTSSQAPFNDGTDHSDGDIWYVQDSDHNTTAMYTYDGSTWNQTKMTTSTMSVGELSALTADLGTVNSGYLNSVEIDSSTIKAANIDATSTITGSTIEGASIEENSSNGKITLDKDGFCAISNGSYLKFISGNSNGYTKIRGSLDVDSINVGASVIEGQTFQAYGGNNTHIGSENAWTYLAESIKCGPGGYISPTSGTDIYFHNMSGATINIHAGDVISHGTALKSTLSDKRDISNYSTSEALAKINSTNVVKWQYIEDNNNPFGQHIGPIIDNVNTIGSKKYYVPNELIISDGKETAFNQSNAISMLISSVQELSKRNDELSLRIAQLERDNNK